VTSRRYGKLLLSVN